MNTIYHSNSCLVLKDLDKSCLYGMINRLLERERERERERVVIKLFTSLI